MPARYEILAGWANEFNWTLGAELGVSDGQTHIYLLEHCPKLSMVGVDIWNLPVKQGATFSNEKCGCFHCLATKAGRRANNVEAREAMARAGGAKFPGRSFLYKEATQTAGRHVAEASLDFVFVDGDHSMEGVRGDVQAWMSKVKPGGRVCGHDINMKSVRDGVAAVLPIEQIQLGDDHLWWIQR